MVYGWLMGICGSSSVSCLAPVWAQKGHGSV